MFQGHSLGELIPQPIPQPLGELLPQSLGEPLGELVGELLTQLMGELITQLMGELLTQPSTRGLRLAADGSQPAACAWSLRLELGASRHVT